MIASFSFSFDEGDGVHSMIVDTKPIIMEEDDQVQEGVIFTTSSTGAVNISVPPGIKTENNSYLYKKVKVKIISWAVDQKYSEAVEVAGGLFFFLWEEPKDPTE